MANPIASSQQVPQINLSNPNPSDDFDSLQFPPLDLDYLSNDLNFSDGFLANLGFDEDFDFNLDDLSFLDENEGFQLDGSDGNVVCQDNDDRSSDNVSRVLNLSSNSNSSSHSPDSGSSDRGCSQESGGCRSVVNGFLNSPSPDSGVDSGHSASPVSSSSPVSCNDRPDAVVVDVDEKKIKVEEGKKGSLKRKCGKEDENPISNSRITKVRRSVTSSTSPDAVEDDDDKRKARLMRNRESAQLSRQRKKHYVEELEDKVKSMHSVIADLNNKVSYFMAENASLRQQLNGGGVCHPPPGVYPPPAIAPMPYPWYPYPMKPHGSQVPLVPIPKLKPQQPISASKVKKPESKKSEGKTGKTKKVASVSFLGLLFFILLFGGLVPLVDVRFGARREMVSNGFGFTDDERIIPVSGHVNGSHSVGVGLHSVKSDVRLCGTNGMRCRRGLTEEVDSKSKRSKPGSQPLPGSDGFANMGNSSEPLVASLYVPRNDKLVKIDGNLIIHSVLASEKAMASSRAASGVKSNKATVSSTDKSSETGLAIAGNLSPAFSVSKGGRNAERHPHVYRISSEQQKALNSGSGDGYKEKSKSADKSLQKWFREGLAGPIFSSGMCTEVFQFDTSPASAAPGAIIPATSTANVSAKRTSDSAHLSKRNRRILSELPITLHASEFNITEEHSGRSPKSGNFHHGNESVSSMVVSVLVDPRENGDGDGEGVISQKSMSRIFVVVLMDSVKYVTYSCILPSLTGSSGPHLVTT